MPGVGWRNRERMSLLERRRPDLVPFPELAHHVVLGRGVPMGELLDWLAGRAPEVLLEIAPREAARVQGLLARRTGAGEEWHVERIEEKLGERFEVARRLELPVGRQRVYCLRRRASRLA